MKDNAASELTIVSVYHNRLSRRLLELNEELTRRLNPEVLTPWLAGDNTPPDVADKINANKFIVISNHDDYHGLGSHQHAGAINKCLTYVKTRFMVSMDSDFYILRKNWIGEILNHMKTHNLEFFGVSYHPAEYQKYRYFPSVVCLFVDLEKVPLASLDFTPQYEITREGHAIRTDIDRERVRARAAFKKSLKRKIPFEVAEKIGQIARTFSIARRRCHIRSARDTGWRIFEKYGDREGIGSECVVPVYDPEKNPMFLGALYRRLNHGIEYFLRDRLCYVPKNKDCYSPLGFRERGFPDLAANGWEEYLWKETPFGTHLRGSKTHKRAKSEDEELHLIEESLKKFGRD